MRSLRLWTAWAKGVQSFFDPPKEGGAKPMPVICMFLGIIIRMYRDTEHNPPHFHAEYQGTSGIFTLEGDMIKGDIPKKQQKFIGAWAELHKDELAANWELAMANEALYKIEPLR